MNPELEAALKFYEERSKIFLESDRKYREAKASFIVSLFDSANRPKRPTEVELNALVDGNTELNNLKFERDMMKVYLDCAKQQMNMLGVAYE